MNRDDILSGVAGLTGIQWMLSGQSSRRLLKSGAQSMLQQGYRAGPFQLTRAKFKPQRKLSAYFTVPVTDAAGQVIRSVHLAAAWQKSLEGSNLANGRERMQEEARRSGLMPVQRELWREVPDQWMELQMWPLDPEFPRLVRLGDPSHVAGMLRSLGIAPDLRQIPLVTPVRYRPGERHVLRYEIGAPQSSAGQAQRWYAKLYSSAQEAARAFDVANRAADWLAASGQGVLGNRPGAVSEEDCVILYPYVPGTPLSRQLHRSRGWFGAQLRTIGASLAILHNGPTTLQSGLKQSSFESELKVVRRASEHIQVLLPESYDKILAVLDQAQAHYSGLPQEQPRFTHSDFKSDHLLCSSRGITLIDFDTCTLTDPALDIGKFLADLDWWFTLKGIAGVEAAQTELLKGYLREAAPDPTVRARLQRARVYHALILVKIVARRVPLYAKDWAIMTARMIELAAQGLGKRLEA